MAEQYAITCSTTVLRWNAYPDDIKFMPIGMQRTVKKYYVNPNDIQAFPNLFDRIFEAAEKCDDYWLDIVQIGSVPYALEKLILSGKYKISAAAMCLFILMPTVCADTVCVRCCHHRCCGHMDNGEGGTLSELTEIINVINVRQIAVFYDGTQRTMHCCGQLCPDFLDAMHSIKNTHVLKLLAKNTSAELVSCELSNDNDPLYISTTNLSFARQSINIFNYYNTLEKLCYLACHKWKIDIRHRHLLEARGDLFMI